jgi:hypothetical protein
MLNVDVHIKNYEKIVGQAGGTIQTFVLATMPKAHIVGFAKGGHVLGGTAA